MIQEPVRNDDRFVDENRQFWKVLVFGLLTLGIYDIVFMCGLCNDLNRVCRDTEYNDSENTPGFIAVLLLSIITIGIYGFVWYYKQGWRMKRAADIYGFRMEETGGTYLVWLFPGILLLGIGPMIACYLLVWNLNRLAKVFNFIQANPELYEPEAPNGVSAQTQPLNEGRNAPERSGFSPEGERSERDVTGGNMVSNKPSDQPDRLPVRTIPGSPAIQHPGQTKTPHPGQTETPRPGQTETPAPGQAETPHPCQTETPPPGQTAESPFVVDSKTESILMGTIEVNAGPLRGRRYKAMPLERVLIGRDGSKCKIAIPVGCRDVSHVHCEIIFNEAGYFMVTDLSTYNRTMLNGTIRLERGVPKRCPLGSILTLGNGDNKFLLN